MRRTLPAIVLVALAAVALSVFAQTTTLRISGIYSNLSYNEEAGDLVGMELFIIPTGSDSSYNGFVQLAEGGFPSVAVVHISIHGSRITFTMPLKPVQGSLHFVGTITHEKITGCWLVNGNCPKYGHEVLRRGKSYWQ